MYKILVLVLLSTICLSAQTVSFIGDGTGISGTGTVSGRTYGSLGNPSTISGVIDSVKFNVYLDAASGADTLYFLTLYLVSGTTYAIRDTAMFVHSGDYANGTLVTCKAGTDFYDLNVEVGDIIAVSTPATPYIRVRMVNSGYTNVIQYNGIFLSGSNLFGNNLTFGLSVAAYYTIPATPSLDENNGYNNFNVYSKFKGY